MGNPAGSNRWGLPCLGSRNARASGGSLDSPSSEALPAEARFWGENHMKMPTIFAAAALVLSSASVPTVPAFSHSGGTNAAGCHNNRKTGDYHCHGGKAPTASRSKGRAAAANSGGYFANCSAARAAGAAPVMRGERGYGSHLDRDGDGVGCE